MAYHLVISDGFGQSEIKENYAHPNRQCLNLSRSANCSQSAAAGLVENAASWDNSRSGFQLKIQIKTLPPQPGALTQLSEWL
jgi:hypothetical protein